LPARLPAEPCRLFIFFLLNASAMTWAAFHMLVGTVLRPGEACEHVSKLLSVITTSFLHRAGDGFTKALTSRNIQLSRVLSL